MHVAAVSRRRHLRRPGAALMLCLFIIFLTTLLVVNILDTLTSDLAAVRNGVQYERALYLANAAVHDAAAELESNPAWRGVLAEGAYPADDTYQAVVANGAAGTVVVTARGAAGGVVRTVTATFQL